MSVKSKRILIAVVSLLCAGMIVFLVYFGYKNSIKGQVDDLYSLSKTVSTEELKQKGFIDVTEPADGENPEIVGFLNNRKNSLKVFAARDGTLYARLFVYDPNALPNNGIPVLQSWTYLPWDQAGMNAGKRFSADYKLVTEDGVTSVKLINIQNNLYPFFPVPEDEILYSYRTGS